MGLKTFHKNYKIFVITGNRFKTYCNLSAKLSSSKVSASSITTWQTLIKNKEIRTE